ncbi:MAG: hypothetical protein PWR04_1090 [Anaerophaga sp.]|nr:hypothetical protein [Anaerophaga sp.]
MSSIKKIHLLNSSYFSVFDNIPKTTVVFYILPDS